MTEISNYAFNASHIQNVLFEEGTQITTIGSQVFRDCPMIREFTLPAGVTTLGKNAFTDSGLVSFTFEDNFMLQVIDEATFRDSNLMSIKFGKNGALQTIGKTAFSGTRLEEIVIPASVTSIGVEAFKNSMLERLDFEKESLCTILDKDSFNNCQNLVFVALPESLKIATQPFKNCENLEVVEIRCNFSQDAINMEEGSDPVFYKDYNIREVNVVEGVTEFSIVDFIDSYGNSGGKIGGAEINIPSTILSLETSSTAFEYLISVNYLGNFEQFCKIQKFDYINASKFNASWTSESEVVIPEGIINVTETILSVFDGIDTLTLSSSVETIAPGLVKNTYVVSQDNQNFTSVDGVLYSKDESVLISYPKDKDSLNFSEKLKEIGDYAFKNCNLFTEIHLPEGIETISPNAFSIGCVIESIYLPNTAILTANLRGDIENFHINADHPLYSSFDNALYSKDFSELLFVPEGKTTISIHSNCSTLCTFSTNLQELIFAEDSVITEINSGFIEGCTRLNVFILPGQLTSIGDSAFDGICSIYFSEIIIPSTVTSIGAHAFSNRNFGNVYSTYIDTITINSAHIFQDTNSSASIGDALGEATTVYVEASLIDEQQLTAGSYLTSNFTRSATAVDGYYVYTRN